MDENNEKVVKTKTSKGVIALLVILILIVIGLSSYIVYDKFISKDNIKEEIKNTKNEEKNESESDENESNSLKGKKFVLSTEGNKKDFYFNFISDTEYECLISDIDGKANNDYKYNSKGTYTYDGKNITLSDSKIDVILKDSMLYVNFDNYKFIDRVAATVACKLSIKANDRITMTDMEDLLDRLRNTKNPFTCPHGRPTIITYSNYELERLFKRVMN